MFHRVPVPLRSPDSDSTPENTAKHLADPPYPPLGLGVVLQLFVDFPVEHHDDDVRVERAVRDGQHLLQPPVPSQLELRVVFHQLVIHPPDPFSDSIDEGLAGGRI